MCLLLDRTYICKLLEDFCVCMYWIYGCVGLEICYIM